MKKKILIGFFATLFVCGLGFAINAASSTHHVEGTVLNSDGSETLSGVTMKISNSTDSWLLDADGSFSVNVTSGRSLIFSKSGYQDYQTDPIFSDQSDVEICMESSSSSNTPFMIKVSLKN